MNPRMGNGNMQQTTESRQSHGLRRAPVASLGTELYQQPNVSLFYKK